MSSVALQLSPRIRRLVAPNPGPFTGEGTNTYIVGTRELAVIDPGPADAAHLAAIVAACDAPLAWILVTHTPADHSPGAKALRERTGALVVGRRAPDVPRQDRRFRPDTEPTDGERVVLEGATLRCLETPGHASNHLCFLLEEERVLFTGDHVLGDVTPVIIPPDGDMADYLASLARLQVLDLAALAPGHGPLLPDPAATLAGLVAHRLRREARIAEHLLAMGGATLEALLPRVYEDVPATLHEIARHTLLAHLIKLEREGRAAREADSWRAS